MSNRDKICIALIASIFLLTGFISERMDASPELVQGAILKKSDVTHRIDVPRHPAATEVPILVQTDYSDEIPLTYELQDITRAACLDSGVPYAMALAVMEQESEFNVDALNPSGCYGLCQLNPDYFPSGLSPAENIKAGVGFLGELLSRYGSAERALTAYYYGSSDRGSGWYSDEVMERMKLWEDVVGCG